MNRIKYVLLRPLLFCGIVLVIGSLFSILCILCGEKWKNIDFEDISTYESGVDIVLHKGVYEIGIDYITESSDGYGIAQVINKGNPVVHALDSNVVLLPYYQNSVNFVIYVNDDLTCANIQINATSEEKPLFISNISIQKKAFASKFYNVWNTLLFVLAVTFVVYGLWWINVVCDAEKKWIYLVLAGLMFLVNLPLLLDYMPDGVDLEIHLNRLAGIAEGLREGQFPVRIHSQMWNGYGYPFGVFYGDIFYYIPALFYILGLPLWRAYRLYVFLINIFTVIISYCAFSKMSYDTGKSSYIGAFGSGIYTLNMWHLSAIYGRAAVGAYTAYMFIPLIIVGLWNLLKKEYYKDNMTYTIFLPLIIGYTGIATSHMLTLLIMCLFTLLICIAYIRRIFEDRGIRLVLLIKAAIVTLLASLGFLLPLLHMTQKHNLYISNFTEHIGQYGIFLPQIFFTEYKVNGIAESIENSIGEDWPQTMGLALVFVGCFAIYNFIIHKEDDFYSKEERKALSTTLILSAVGIFMSTVWFPYDKIQKKFPHIFNIIGRIQTPNRYLLASTVILVIIGVIVLNSLFKKNNKTALRFSYIVILLLLWQGINYFSTYCNIASKENSLDKNSSTIVSYSKDYLYLFNGININLPYEEYKAVSYDEVEVLGEAKNGTKHEIHLKNLSNASGYVILPIYNYLGYKAYLNGKQTSIMEDTNHRIEIAIPPNFGGTLEIKYDEPIAWRVAELISLLSLIAIIIYAVGYKKSNKYEQNTKK